MALEKNHAKNHARSKAKGEEERGENETKSKRHMNIADFLFDSAYQVVTWVLITLSIGAIFYFASKDSGRGIMWSCIVLLCSIALMLGIIADRKFFNTEQPEVSVDQQGGKPHVFFKTTGLKNPLTAGEKVVIEFILSNNGSADATVKLWDNTYFFNVKPFRNKFAYIHYPPTSAMIAAGQDINAELRFDFSVTSEKLKALESGEARLLFFARGEYVDSGGNRNPLPFCRIWDKEIRGNLVFCPNDLLLTDQAEDSKPN